MGQRASIAVAVGACAVLAFAVWALRSAPASREPERSAPRKLEAREVVAREIAAQLREHRAVVESVEAKGDSVTLLGGRLRLAVIELRDPESHAASGHFHVVAEAPAAKLDACIFSVDPDDGGRSKGAASIYTGVALPPILSQVKGDVALDAVRFHGTEPWGVPGRRGFVGSPGVRGAQLAAFAEAPLFADLSGLPADGRPHLLKVLLYNRDGVWLRAVEIDGEKPLVRDQRWDRIPAPTAFATVVRFAVVEGADGLRDPAARKAALEGLEARPAWLFPADECPADVLPAELPEMTYSDQACRGGRLADCVAECQRGARTSCYAAALELEAEKLAEAAAQALYLRACRLGAASGCTNAASGRVKVVGYLAECSLRTFEAVCERAGDPWACTMAGVARSKGDRRLRNLARAREHLGKSCRYGAQDPACATATKVLAEIGDGL